MLESTISAVRNALMFTPMLWAYASPSWYAPMGLAMRNVAPPVMPTTVAATPTLLQFMPEKLPLDQLCRFTISESAANVTVKSVMAVQM